MYDGNTDVLLDLPTIYFRHSGYTLQPDKS